MNRLFQDNWIEVSESDFAELVLSCNYLRDGWYNADVYREKVSGQELGIVYFDPKPVRYMINPAVFKPA